ncbi:MULTISPECIES: DUF3331 domain-containing protein [unclassified Caballeronia]|uniref:DUF3331 domain-containing protein n=1 Tax=unclassified Caballeronia TaxID=2646786 RepID=UPI002856EF77|nr:MULTISPECIES: DUF3331 domain-containing protein [unclassified Caballeronia]MDR5774270.1 DUF3331 domain-containing protein [Caballeronia sp. LZ002]MDR5849705.1 DUF3331 domain-containing protein [Caballeronia sp. LZ003]
MPEALVAERRTLPPRAARGAEVIANLTLGAVWTHVIDALQGGNDMAHRAALEALKRMRGRETQPFADHARIEVLERLSSRTIAILWQDATRCRYADQVWVRCQARKIGRCALTGAGIVRGDIVYKPQRRNASLGNARAMILASALPD